MQEGSETWISHKERNNSLTHQLARNVQDLVTVVMGYRDRGMMKKHPDPSGVNDPDKHFFKIAILLVEIRFITDPSDESRLTASISGDQYKLRLAEALSFAIFHISNIAD